MSYFIFESLFRQETKQAPRVNIYGRNSLSPSRHSFFLIPHSQNLELKAVPPAEREGEQILCRVEVNFYYNEVPK